jgi:hypothetical protein
LAGLSRTLSMMPLSLPGVHVHHAGMTIRLAAPTLLVEDGRRPGRLVCVTSSRWLGPISRLVGGRLDRQLACGRPPESNRLLAARAVWLVSASALMGLAGNWADVLERVQRPRYPRDPCIPVCRDRVITARPEVEQLLRALAVPAPRPVRGAAMASWLLSDGSGPLYNPRSPRELDAALRETIEQLDPSLPLEPAVLPHGAQGPS